MRVTYVTTEPSGEYDNALTVSNSSFSTVFVAMSYFMATFNHGCAMYVSVSRYARMYA